MEWMDSSPRDSNGLADVLEFALNRPHRYVNMRTSLRRQ